MKTRIATVAACVLAGIASAAQADSAATFTSGPTTVGHSGNSATTLGWIFTVDSPVAVTGLGYYDDGSGGLSEVHEVGIFDSGGSLLFSASVPDGTTGALVAGFRYVAITPVVLSTGDYTVGGTIGAQASDPVAYDVTGLASAAHITIPSGASRYTEGGTYTSLTFPSLAFPPSSPYNAYFGPNFQVSAVPEPSIAVLMCVGALGLFAARRHQITA